jgi:hypothetical protein
MAPTTVDVMTNQTLALSGNSSSRARQVSRSMKSGNFYGAPRKFLPAVRLRKSTADAWHLVDGLVTVSPLANVASMSYIEMGDALTPSIKPLC